MLLAGKRGFGDDGGGRVDVAAISRGGRWSPRLHHSANIFPRRTACDADHVFAVGAAVAVAQLGIFRRPLADFTTPCIQARTWPRNMAGVCMGGQGKRA